VREVVKTAGMSYVQVRNDDIGHVVGSIPRGDELVTQRSRVRGPRFAQVREPESTEGGNVVECAKPHLDEKQRMLTFDE
jgi:hypothetical protein